MPARNTDIWPGKNLCKVQNLSPLTEFQMTNVQACNSHLYCWDCLYLMLCSNYKQHSNSYKSFSLKANDIKLQTSHMLFFLALCVLGCKWRHNVAAICDVKWCSDIDQKQRYFFDQLQTLHDVQSRCIVASSRRTHACDDVTMPTRASATLH